MMSRRNGCSGKVRHADRIGAIIAAKRVKNDGLNIYSCPKCKGWHLGTSNNPYRVAGRIEQLLANHKPVHSSKGMV